MTGKKLLNRTLNLIAVTLAVFFFISPKISHANYYIGIVGIESRVKNINLGDYKDLDSLNKHPLLEAQDIFEEILTTDLPQTGLIGVDKTLSSKAARQSEAEFQKMQEVMRQSFSSLEKGNTSEVVKLFDKELDYLIYGYLTNLTITHRESLATSNLTVRVDLSTRIVDAKTGKVVCVATGKGESASHGGTGRKAYNLGGKEISEESWHDAITKAVNQIVDRIKQQV